MSLVVGLKLDSTAIIYLGLIIIFLKRILVFYS